MPVDWNRRYFQQGRWTKPLRDYLITGVGLQPTSRTIEVGCGTGAICSDLQLSSPGFHHGLDVNFPGLLIATRNNLKIGFSCGNALELPFPEATFDLVYCHYFLLWVSKPLQALLEMNRILKPGGTLLVFAEPDHKSRIDFPSDLEFLGKLQSESLKKQGADVSIGRKLSFLLTESGFMNIEYGVSGFQSPIKSIPEWWESEWEIIFDDLREIMDKNELVKLREMDKSYWESGARVLWVPTFYARCNKL